MEDANAVCAEVDDWSTDPLYKYSGCCDAIIAHCKDSSKKGCNKYAMATYDRNCDASFASGDDFTPTVTLLAGLKDSEKTCNPVCANSCGYIAEASENKENPTADTYKFCSACDSSLEKRKYNGKKFVAKCFVGARGFSEQVCCGVSPECGQQTQRDVCNVYPSDMSNPKLKCMWSTKDHCAEIVAAQIIEASPEGCCAGEEGVKQVNCEGKEFT